jgi:hypothetical protein
MPVVHVLRRLIGGGSGHAVIVTPCITSGNASFGNRTEAGLVNYAG